MRIDTIHYADAVTTRARYFALRRRFTTSVASACVAFAWFLLMQNIYSHLQSMILSNPVAYSLGFKGALNAANRTRWISFCDAGLISILSISFKWPNRLLPYSVTVFATTQFVSAALAHRPLAVLAGTYLADFVVPYSIVAIPYLLVALGGCMVGTGVK